MDVMRVFIVKVPENYVDGRWVPKYAPSKAERYGKIVKLLNSGPSLMVDDIAEIERGLRDFNDGDYLILAGSPVQMGVAAHVALRRMNGAPVKFLTWDNRMQEYLVQEVICE